jgi:dihydrolipoamide dehydrogenase
MTDFDLVVLGGGPGGYVCAIRAAQLGLKTALVEMDRLGGECLNYGCIPSKSLISVAKIFDKFRNGAELGLRAEKLEVDFGVTQAWKKRVVDTLESGIEQLCKGYRVTVIKGEAELQDRKRMTVTEKGVGRDVSFEKLVIATGSKPVELQNLRFDGDNVIGSREALELQRPPGSLIVVGGGVVGMEIASLYQKLGTRVEIVELTDQLLPGTDKDISRIVQRSVERRGAKVYLRSRVLSVDIGKGGLKARVQTSDGEVSLEAEKLLLSVGRKPRTEKLSLQKIGVITDERGFIKTDRRMMTSVEGIFAIGDVRGAPLLAHKASKEGIVAAEAAAGLPTEAQWRTIPDAIFTDPEVASAGMTEQVAKEAGIPVKVSRFQFAALGRALAGGEKEGFVKIVSDSRNGLVLGVQIVGPEASDLISEATLAIEMGATVEDIALTIHPHPTFPEAIMEASESAAGRPIHQLRLGGGE